MALSGAAQAQAPAPTLLYVGPGTIDLNTAQAAGQSLDRTVLLLNVGDDQAVVSSIALRLDNADACHAMATLGTPVHIKAHGRAQVVAAFSGVNAHSCSGDGGRIVLRTRGDASAPVIVPVLFVRTLDDAAYLVALISSLVVASALVLGVAFEAKRPRHSTSKLWDWLKSPTSAGAAWSFQGSWVTNLSVIGGVLTSVAAASGLLNDVLPGIDLAHVIGLNIAFGGMLVASPAIWIALSQWTLDANQALASLGTRLGLFVASLVTLWGVIGGVITMAVLTLYSVATVPDKVGVLVLLLGLLVIVGVYATRFTYRAAVGVVDIRTGSGAGTSPQLQAVRTAAL
jgi:hypothetical protein